MGKKVIQPSPLLEKNLRLAIRHLRRAARTDVKQLSFLNKLTGKGASTISKLNPIVHREVEEMRAICDYFEHVVKRMEIPEEQKLKLPVPYR